MNWPLIVLAVLAFFGGAVVMFLPQFIHGVTAGMVPLHEAAHGAAHGAAEVAHGAAEAAHGAAEAAGGLKVGHPMEPWSLTKTFTDPLTYVSIGAGLLGVLGAWFGFGPEKFARGWSPAGERLLDAHARIYEGLAHSVVVRGGWAFSQALYQFIDRGIDWVVNATGTFTNYLAESLRTLQTGYVRNYALVMLAGAVFVVACFMVILQQTSK